MVHRLSSTLAVVAIILEVLQPVSSFAQPHAADQPVRVDSECLLLQNGEVIYGEVEFIGGEYRVNLPFGGQIRFRREQVAHRCRNLDHAYQLQLEGRMPLRAVDHVDLAQWCLRVQLRGYAAHHLVQATILEPNHPRLEALRRRLRIMDQPSSAMVPHEPPRRPRDSSPGGQATPRSFASGKPSRSPIQLLSYEEPNDHGQPPSNSEDLAPHEVPAKALEQFTRTVQPLLLNGCGAAGCHGGRGRSSFRLVYVGPYKQPTRHVTLANLQAVLKYVDRNDPEDSPLATAPSRGICNDGKSIFGPREQRHHQELVDWINTVVAATQDRGTKADTSEIPGHPPTTPGESDTSTGDGFTPADPGQASATEEASPESPIESQQDPFDPAAFNRQHHPRDSGN